MKGGEDTERPRELSLQNGYQRGNSHAENTRRVNGQKVACRGIPWREEIANGQDNLPFVYISSRLVPVPQLLNGI